MNERKAKWNEGYQHVDSNTALLQYLSKITSENRYYKFLIVPIDNSCAACIPVYAKIIKENRSFIFKNKIAVILISSNKNAVPDFMASAFPEDSKAWFENDQKKIIYTDTTRQYLHYFDMWVNPLYLVTDDRGTIIYKKIINPGDMNELREKLSE